jgi:hypothetical protein
VVGGIRIPGLTVVPLVLASVILSSPRSLGSDEEISDLHHSSVYITTLLPVANCAVHAEVTGRVGSACLVVVTDVTRWASQTVGLDH